MIRLPEYILKCIRLLEQAGFQAYAVGGCVRDCLLGLVPHDYDLCTDATPEQTCQVFSQFPLIHNGEKHGTVGVVMDADIVEITTFRTEGGYQDSRHPDWVRFVGRVEEDLARRDFTVNAMAYNPRVGLVDPWGGRADLENKILRAVGEPERRFTEDALRILRGARFAAGYHLTPEPETEKAMFRFAPAMSSLAKERVFEELCKLLLLTDAAHLDRFAPVLTQAIPALAVCRGFAQHSPHHAYDVFTHTAHVIQALPRNLALRWAALLHDIGKPAVFTLDDQGRGHFLGHAQVSAQMADAILKELKSSTALREQVVFLISHHMTPLEPDARLLRRRLGRWGVENTMDLLSLQQADMGSKGTGKPADDTYFDRLRQMIRDILAQDACLNLRDLAVSGHDLLSLGYPAGKSLGACLQRLLDAVLDEQLPNEKDALLDAAQQYLTEESL